MSEIDWKNFDAATLQPDERETLLYKLLDLSTVGPTPIGERQAFLSFAADVQPYTSVTLQAACQVGFAPKRFVILEPSYERVAVFETTIPQSHQETIGHWWWRRALPQRTQPASTSGADDPTFGAAIDD